jgi:hypothetical protein
MMLVVLQVGLRQRKEWAGGWPAKALATSMGEGGKGACWDEPQFSIARSNFSRKHLAYIGGHVR